VKTRTFKNPLSPKERGILEYSKIDLLEFTSDEVHNSIHVWCEGQPIIVINKSSLKPLAKFCLHEQPFGFTKKHITALRIASGTKKTGEQIFDSPKDFDSTLDFIADLIEELLEEEAK